MYQDIISGCLKTCDCFYFLSAKILWDFSAHMADFFKSYLPNISKIRYPPPHPPQCVLLLHLNDQTYLTKHFCFYVLTFTWLCCPSLTSWLFCVHHVHNKSVWRAWRHVTCLPQSGTGIPHISYTRIWIIHVNPTFHHELLWWDRGLIWKCPTSSYTTVVPPKIMKYPGKFLTLKHGNHASVTRYLDQWPISTNADSVSQKLPYSFQSWHPLTQIEGPPPTITKISSHKLGWVIIQEIDNFHIEIASQMHGTHLLSVLNHIQFYIWLVSMFLRQILALAFIWWKRNCISQHQKWLPIEVTFWACHNQWCQWGLSKFSGKRVIQNFTHDIPWACACVHDTFAYLGMFTS